MPPPRKPAIPRGARPVAGQQKGGAPRSGNQSSGKNQTLGNNQSVGSAPGNRSQRSSPSPVVVTGRSAKSAAPTQGKGSRSTVQGGEPIPARTFSGRVVLLIAVLMLVALMLTPAMNNFLQQRAEIASIKTEIAYQERYQSELRKELSRWDDPAYVKMQARDRINMVMPGETGYWVFGSIEGSRGTPATPDQPGTAVNPEGRPWLDGLRQSIIRSATE